jgi:peptidoglycan/LPS O-acetylase OafA/YrhL
MGNMSKIGKLLKNSFFPENRIWGLDLLRCAAVLMVMFCHGILLIYEFFPQIIMNILFAVSGF